MYFKYLKYFLILTVIIFSCDDIDRDNILDPKNPSSDRPKIVTVEAFVNTSHTALHRLNDTLLIALNQIKNIYKDKIAVMEYHRKTTGTIAYDDSLKYILNETIYDNYLNGLGVNNKGVPDVFINGIDSRIQGASTVQNSVFRLEEALQQFIIQNSFFTLEPYVSVQYNEINLSLKIARLGSTTAQDFIVKAVVIYRLDDDIFKRVVYGIGKSTIIKELDNGEIKDVDIDPIPVAGFQYQSISVIFMITSDDELEVYQSIEVDLN